MGRRRYKRYGQYELPPDRKLPDEKNVTETQLAMFADESFGPVAYALYEQKLVRPDESGALRVDRAAVQKNIQTIKDQVVATREYPKEKFTEYAVESTGRPARSALAQTNQEYKAKAMAIYLAARAGGVSINPADKRVLNALADGKFVEYVYGKKGEYESGTIATRMKATRGAANYKDPAQRARAREQADRLREYTQGDTSRYRYA